MPELVKRKSELSWASDALDTSGEHVDSKIATSQIEDF